MALPLAWRDGRPEPATVAPGRQVETMRTGPNRDSMLLSSDCAAPVRQLREVPPPPSPRAASALDETATPPTSMVIAAAIAATEVRLDM